MHARMQERKKKVLASGMPEQGYTIPSGKGSWRNGAWEKKRASRSYP